MRRTGWRAMLLTAGALGISMSGCAHFVDTISSREFKVKDLFVSPDPLTVLRESRDGDARAKAMHRLEEPPASNSELREEILQYLTDAATNDPRPLCRLAAIEALGRFEDPRTADVLLKAYHAASAFSTDLANPIRCEAMTSLSRKNSAEGLALLVQVASAARAATARTNDVKLASFDGGDELNRLLGAYDPDNQAARDARLAAIRALGVTRSPQAIPALLPLLAEKDVALRDRAQEALQLITGKKNVAPDAEAWRAAIGAGT